MTEHAPTITPRPGGTWAIRLHPDGPTVAVYTTPERAQAYLDRINAHRGDQ